MAQVRTRKEIPVEHTWDTASIFPTEEAWETEFKSMGAELPSLAKHRGHLGDGPAALTDGLDAIVKALWPALPGS